ncbi:MAG: vitamin K epoxide reductase family protein [Planctomycetes bacterium]|nr:vitamin K epoxide reductase family protein [Planctomycetota bacterium]
MNAATNAVPERPPRLALALSVALLLVSIVAVAIQHLQLCGGCALRQGLFSAVAPGGVFGYGALAVIGWLGPWRLFPWGAAFAAAVHTVLVAAMVMHGHLCIVCVVAATLALALFVVMIVRSNSRLKLIAFAYVPAAILAAGPTSWALAHDEAMKKERDAFIRAIRDSHFTEGAADVLTIQVFEQDHCGYCRDFRELYLPRLEREFGPRIRVRFLSATATTWVRHTPTIVIETGLVYEGLPRDYSEIRSAIEAALAARK